jgi:hypothetical protein
VATPVEKVEENKIKTEKEPKKTGARSGCHSKNQNEEEEAEVIILEGSREYLAG